MIIDTSFTQEFINGSNFFISSHLIYANYFVRDKKLCHPRILVELGALEDLTIFFK